MSTGVYIATLSLFFGTILLVFAMRYASAAFAARARLANEGAYRTLAEEAVSGQARTQATLAAIQADLAQLTARLGAVETILKQVG